MSLTASISALAQAVGEDVKSILQSLGQKLSEAPVDGQTYGRKNGAWAVAPTGGGGGSSNKRPHLWS